MMNIKRKVSWVEKGASRGETIKMRESELTGRGDFHFGGERSVHDILSAFWEDVVMRRGHMACSR
jgi:hypothetical protein